jgi:FlhB HrpN YscU SpaS Family
MAEENSESNERTEDPTPRRLEEAQRRGDVVKSMEVNTWFTIAGGTLAIMVFAAPMASSLQATFRGLIATSYQIPTDGAALRADEDARLRCRRRFRRAASGPVRRRFRRQHRAAPHRVHDRIRQAAIVADFADGRLRSPVLEAGAGELCQGAGQALRGRRGHGGVAVAAAPNAGRHCYSRSGDAAVVHPLDRAEAARHPLSPFSR